CVDLKTTTSHCGSCATACPTGQVCNAGSCGCTTGLSLCSGQCVDLTTNGSNCGQCGTTCSGGRSCSGGTCNCPSGQTFCSSWCVDTKTSTANCGTCGHACGAGQTCSNGTCTGGSTTGKAFSQCRFHFGTIDSKETGNASMRAEMDFFSPGWMGSADTFN